MKIVIENLKGIRHLKFDVPEPGLWLLTGINGSGKTSLLASLYRIGYGRAFQDCFKTNVGQDRIDTFEKTKIKYHIDGKIVTYAYGGTRWRPRPSKNSKIFDTAPYESVVFVGVDASRIEPFPDEIEARNFRDVSDEIRATLHEILRDKKWLKLKYVNTRRGRGSEAYLIKRMYQRPPSYYSEKSFSLGELCVLKLAKKLHGVANNSLVLIDEIEMALHPQAQIRLLKKIKEIADEKDLTVVFSTHSTTLIKIVDRKNIILLRDVGKNWLEATSNVFPAEVLGELAFGEEMNADFVLLVEDDQAKLLLEQLCALYMQGQKRQPPSYSILPIGGYRQVMDFLERIQQLIPNYVKRCAFLDEDVIGTIDEARKLDQRTIIDLYERVQENVRFLPCTPEVAVIEALERHQEDNNWRSLRIDFDGNIVRLDHFMQTDLYMDLESPKPRKLAKKKLNAIVAHASGLAGMDDIHVRRTLYQKYCQETFHDNRPELMRLLNPVFNM
jgi:ABC-type lipoprotein export system ATPase subunit